MNLDGKWRVKVTSGPRSFRLLNLTGNIKVIKGDKGHNIAFKFIRWGDFKISQNDGITLTYTKKPIVDEIIMVDEDNGAGEFFYKKEFIGNFTIKRIG